MLAQHFGGGPAYWLDPDLPDELVETALDLVWRQSRRRREGADHE